MFTRKARKIFNFLGSPESSGFPVFVNSMPKAGTNLLEEVLIQIGYKRELSRCLNEVNYDGAQLKTSRGRFYLMHLHDFDPSFYRESVSIYLHRDFWPIIKSYVNFMMIDKSHQCSHWMRAEYRHGRAEAAIRNLLFTSNNPLKRSLCDEYSRFSEISLRRYNAVVNYDGLMRNDDSIVRLLSLSLDVSEDSVRSAIQDSLAADTFTKTSAAVPKLTDCISTEFLASLEAEVINSKANLALIKALDEYIP